MKSKIIAAMDAAGYHFDELESSDDQLRFAEEVKGTGVTVTAICPGPTATGFEQAASMKKGAVMFRKAADAGSVAAAGIRAMEKGKALCYQGFFTKTMNIGARIMPRAVTRYFAHKMNQ